eukprot:8970414-Pyramimonas_sp.AAC.1
MPVPKDLNIQKLAHRGLIGWCAPLDSRFHPSGDFTVACIVSLPPGGDSLDSFAAPRDISRRDRRPDVSARSSTFLISWGARALRPQLPSTALARSHRGPPVTVTAGYSDCYVFLVSCSLLATAKGRTALGWTERARTRTASDPSPYRYKSRETPRRTTT